jgi:hypothetical protein
MVGAVRCVGLVGVVGGKHTSLPPPVMSGNWLSNAAVAEVAAGAAPPPPRRSLSSSSVASSTVANWLASSPRMAFSRSRKLLADGTSDTSLISVWTASQGLSAMDCFILVTSCLRGCGSDLPPESNSSSEGNRSAMLGI